MSEVRQTKLANGRTIAHKEVVFNHTITTFSLRERIRILFGKKVFVNSDIFTFNDEVQVVASQSTSYVEPFRKKSRGGFGEVMSQIAQTPKTFAE